MKHSLAILLLCVAVANAETIYVSQSGSGAGTGVGPSDRMSLANLNNASNWSTTNVTGKVNFGDTVSLNGTFTSTLFVRGSGTSGNPITILFEPNAVFTATFWAETVGAININANNYITIDGGTNGTIKAVGNGAFLASQVESIAIEALGNCNNLIIRNMIIKDMYMQGPVNPEVPANTVDGKRLGGGIHLNNAGNDVLIENNFLESCGDFAVGAGAAGTQSNLVIRNNIMTRMNHGISYGTFVNGTRITGLKIYGNRFDEFSWHRSLKNDVHHLDGIIFIMESPAISENFDGVEIYNNTFGPDVGGPVFTPAEYADAGIAYPGAGSAANTRNTAAIFVDAYVPSQWTNAKTYNNLFLHNTGESWNNSALSGSGLIANNTFINGNGLSIGNNATVRNNVFINNGTAIKVGGTDYTSSTSDYNVFSPNAGFHIFPGNGNPTGSGPPSPNSLVGWQAEFGRTYDQHSTATTVLLDSNYVPTASDTGARNQGVPTPMSTYFNVDKRGVARPQETAWDKGAMEFAPTGGPIAPAVSSSAINAAGTQFAITFGESVVFGGGGNGGMSLSSAGGAITLGTPTVAGTVITYPITNRLIGSGEAVTRSYTQPGNGIEASDDFTDAVSFSGVAVTNSSTVPQVSTPTFAPPPGSYSGTQNVSMSSSGTSIRYTTNGTDPTASSTLYTAPIVTSLSTTYKSKGFASGQIDSPTATGAYLIGDFIFTNTWSNFAVATQTGTFTWTFRATSSSSPNDAVMALADHNAAGYADLAVIPRFGPAGVIDAYNGLTSAYAAVNSFPYTAGQAYDVAVTVNIPAHTYSMTVVQAGGSTPTTIATNYGFRGASTSAVDLDVFSGISSVGTVTISNMNFSSTGTGISRTGMSTNTAGTQLTVNFNTQPAFGTGGQSGFTVSASGGAVTASNPVIGTNAITWQTLSRVIGRGETLSATYAQPGNGIEAASGGADLASFAGQTVVNNSTVDLTPPTPNPSTFSIAPTTTSSSTITMTATISTDAFSGPVSYFFNETSGNAGGSDSGWQTGPGAQTFTDTGLAAGTQYTYRVQTRDSAPTPNVTTFSVSASATTRSVAGARPARPFNTARASIVTP